MRGFADAYSYSNLPAVNYSGSGLGTGGSLALTILNNGTGTGPVTSVYPGESTLTSIGSGYEMGDVVTCCTRGTSMGFTATLATSASITSKTQDYNNSRIEAPQYITVMHATDTMPVWDQYLFDTAATAPNYDNSIIYWNVAAVPATN